MFISNNTSKQCLIIYINYFEISIHLEFYISVKCPYEKFFNLDIIRSLEYLLVCKKKDSRLACHEWI